MSGCIGQGGRGKEGPQLGVVWIGRENGVEGEIRVIGGMGGCGFRGRMGRGEGAARRNGFGGGKVR